MDGWSMLVLSAAGVRVKVREMRGDFFMLLNVELSNNEDAYLESHDFHLRMWHLFVPYFHVLKNCIKSFAFNSHCYCVTEGQCESVSSSWDMT